MAAGLGFKTFTTGEVLTAADTNGYLMQGVLVFASSAARAAAITSPQEGQYSYLKDTNSTEYYDGAAWIAAPIGDITGVTAGVGISGGGTSGDVTVTNSMATAITTSGDLIYGTGSGTFTRRGIGSTGNVLTVSGGVPVWAAPAGGGKVLQVIHASTSTETTNATTTFATTNLTATITPTLNTSKILVLVSQNGVLKDTTAAQAVKLQLLRGATVLSSIADRAGWTNTAIYNNTAVSFNWLDSPATTSSTTYKTEFAKLDSDAGSTVYCQNSNSANKAVSTITLMEIGA